MKKNYQKPSMKAVRIQTIQMIAVSSPGTHESMGQTGTQFSRGSRDSGWDDDEE